MKALIIRYDGANFSGGDGTLTAVLFSPYLKGILEIGTWQICDYVDSNVCEIV